MQSVVNEYEKIFGRNKIVVTTEKDAMRLVDSPYFRLFKNIPLFYVPIEVKFHKTEELKYDKQVLEYVRKVRKKTVEYIKSVANFEPEIGVILGTGLGGLVDEMKITAAIPYTEIPNFPISTVHGHQGRLIFGELSGRKLVAMQGRFHYYEGYSSEEVTFPVRIMKLLGVKLLIVSNASGGLNADFAVGDLMLINDHINLMPNPLIGKNDERLGTRFPDMSEAYDKNILQKALEVAKKLDIKVHQAFMPP